MWNDPQEIINEYPLYAGGTIRFGMATNGGGQRVGTAPLMAQINIPESCGHYPDGWFVIKRLMMPDIRRRFSNEISKKSMNMLPVEILCDCFEYHYNVLRHKQ